MATYYGNTPIIFGHPDQPKALSLEHPKARYGGFHPGTSVLPKGLVKRKGCRPLPCDIVFERDVPVQVRDGAILRVDVYRPVHLEGDNIKVPAIMGWSPYGKEGGAGNQVLDDFPFRMGVPLSKLTELQKWEGPDPGYWVQYGYAVIAPDSRGVGKSEGNIYQFGSQEGRDGADVVDWAGSQDWCNGKVATTGNSWLTIAQWFIAAEKPKHLACISPWEGFSDMIRHCTHPGGVLGQGVMDFVHGIVTVNAGENSWENTSAMIMKYPDWTSWHEDKRAKVENINVPAFVAASYGNPVHTLGTFHTWTRLKTNKWLRIHDSWEWPDYYSEAAQTDLHRFFDHFLKSIDNGWEETPRVRAKIINTKHGLPLNGAVLESNAWPNPAATRTKYFLDPGSGTFNTVYPASSAKTFHCLDDGFVFTHAFDEDVILTGPIEIKLAVSLRDGTDADIFVEMEKILVDGKVGSQCMVPFEEWYQKVMVAEAHRFRLAPELIFYKGPRGLVRVSRRLIDDELSSFGFPIVRMDKSSPVKEGEVVSVMPQTTPIGMSFAKGEKLNIHLSGRNPFEFPPTDKIGPPAPKVPTINDAVKVTLHGGQADGSGSYVVFPVMKN